MENDVIEKIGEALHVSRTRLSKATKITDLVQDSMDVIELMAVLSSEYGLRIESSHLIRMKTVGDIVHYVMARARHESREGGLKTF